MQKELLENHKIYLARKKLFKSLGYDIDKERSFVFKKAQPILGNILEIGTGKGHFAVALAKTGIKFTTVDISEENQEYAKLNLEYYGIKDLVKFMLSDARKLDFKDRSFNVIFSINTIHHLEEPIEVLEEMVRLIALGGKIVLSDFNKFGLELMDKLHKKEGGSHNSGKIKHKEVEKFFMDRGFKTQTYETKTNTLLISNL